MAIQTGSFIFYFALQTQFPDLNVFYKCYLGSLAIKEHFKTDSDESGVNKSEACRLNFYEGKKLEYMCLRKSSFEIILKPDHWKNVYFSKFTYYRI